MARGQVPVWVWVVLASAHLLAMVWALNKGSWDFPDSGRYLQVAENLRVHSELYARPWPQSRPYGQAVQEFTIRPLGYPIAILALRGYASRPVLLLLAQNLLSLFSIGLVLRWWARRAQPDRSKWVVVLIGILTFPAQFIYANAVMSEVILQAVVLAIAGAGILFIGSHKKRYFVAVAGAIVLALLTKPIFYPLAVGFAGVGVLVAWRLKRKNLVLVGIGPLVVVGLYMGWNWQRTGYFHFSSITEINLLHYNAAGVVRRIEGPAAEEQWVANVLRQADAQPSFAARQQVIQDRAGVVLRAHPAVYAWQHLQGMVTLFLDPSRFDISQFMGMAPLAGGGLLAQARSGGLLSALASLPLGVLGMLGLVLLVNVVRLLLAVRGFLLLKHDAPMLRQGRWIAAGLLLYVALLTGPLGAARFLVPVWPLLLGLALVGLQWRAVPDLSDAEQAAPVREDQR